MLTVCRQQLPCTTVVAQNASCLLQAKQSLGVATVASAQQLLLLCARDNQLSCGSIAGTDKALIV